jgi:hypothetical protein
MHHLDLGLFHYQIEYTRELLKELVGTSIIDEMDRRLAKIPRFPGLKIFSHGIQTIARFTAKEYRELMKVMVFVIDDLYNDAVQNKEHFVKNKELAKLYEMWNVIYEISRYEKFSEKDLEKFKVI